MMLEAVVVQKNKIQGIKRASCYLWDWKGTLHCWGLNIRAVILGSLFTTGGSPKGAYFKKKRKRWRGREGGTAACNIGPQREGR